MRYFPERKAQQVTSAYFGFLSTSVLTLSMLVTNWLEVSRRFMGVLALLNHFRKSVVSCTDVDELDSLLSLT